MKTFMKMLMWVGPDLKEDVIKFWQDMGHALDTKNLTFSTIPF